MAIREGVWDCRYCGAKGVRGSSTCCSGCGAPRDAEVRMYLPEDAQEVLDKRALERARAGADWQCPYCGNDNPAGQKSCQGCGATADGSEKRRGPSPSTNVPKAVPAPRPVRRLWPFVVGVSALIAAGVYFLAFSTHEEPLEVVGHSWSRQIEVERLMTVAEEAWEGSVPSDARVLSSHREKYRTDKIQTGTRQVKTGSRDLGNGYFEDVYTDQPVYEERPVYKNKIRYEVDRFRPVRTEKAEGRDKNPRWPPVSLLREEREGARREIYTLLLKGKDGEKTFDLSDPARWSAYEVGQQVRAQIRAAGSVAEIEPPGGTPPLPAEAP